MNRKVLLVEPNYRNKYPPIGLMKLSTYHKLLGDDVTFYKGTFRDFVVEEIYSELLRKLTVNDSSILWEEKKDLIQRYIKLGHESDFQKLSSLSSDVFVLENLRYYKNLYKKKEYLKTPKWDRICITTLFTFHWKITIDTINSFKLMCKNPEQVFVGGIAASLVPKEIYKETRIKPIEGLLDKTSALDDNDIIIDELPLDYSILHEIDYVYPENEGYYGYMTRGCVNKCNFCAVPVLEPEYRNYISIKNQIQQTNEKFGQRRNLLLLDNNVLASAKFNDIIEEIKACGFTNGATYLPPNEYEVAIKGLQSGYNDKGYTKLIIKLYRLLIKKSNENTQKEIYHVLSDHNLLSSNTAKKENIIEVNSYFEPLFRKISPATQRKRFVDFNQGIDARLINEDNIKKLAEIPIQPLRIAFDSWNYRHVYENAIRLAAKNGIKKMSNYMLYNYNDKPIDLYRRLKLNIDLCEELGISIYSFPMKYHPIKDPKYFKNRTYTGRHWNRKFVRAIQAVLNSTKGKIGTGKSFFEEAFGCNDEEFEKILYMPETFIIYRMYYKSGLTQEWWNAFQNLSENKLAKAKEIIHLNNFESITEITRDEDILKVLRYYTIKHEDTERDILIENY
ncbi:MAG: hypothetical protein ACC612_00445 [Methanomethylovorans sp.]|uniref:hypothetical protein n=1 Tax=Methanomethylovorans sp. TaxID=2758717 RepID=UPI00353171EF